MRDLAGFMNEVRLLASCHDPRVVVLRAASVAGTLVKTSGDKREVVYHVTDCARFGEIFKILKKTGPFDERVARTYFHQLLKGIEYLHTMGIVHRDIKTENLLLDERLNLVIADFGSAARSRNAENKAVEFDSSVSVGSLLCNAPEINMEKTYSGEKADIFSAAVCLFLMVLGCPPFGEASGRDAYFKLLLRKNKAAYWNIYKSREVSAGFRNLFEKMTERDPAKRLSLQAIYTHPWMTAEPILSSEELRSLLCDKLASYQEARMKKLGRSKRRKDEDRKFAVDERGIRTMSVFSDWVAECAEINSRLHTKAESGPSVAAGKKGKEEEKAILADEKRKDDYVAAGQNPAERTSVIQSQP